MYKKILVLTIAIILTMVFTVGVFAENTQSSPYQMGVILDPEQKLDINEKKVSSNSVSVVDHSNRISQPGDQGNQSSCVGWAVSYTKSFYDGIELNKIVELSPSFIYNQINGGYDYGAYPLNGLQLLKEKGICTLQTMPYNKSDYLTQPILPQLQEAKYYKTTKYKYGYIDGLNGLNYIKNYLQDNVMMMVVPVFWDMVNIWEGNPVYDKFKGCLLGYHAITIVGYDDNKKAFKFINSWGTDWGLNGYGYISYNLVKNNKHIMSYIITDQLNEKNNNLYINDIKCNNSKIINGKMITHVRNLVNYSNYPIQIDWKPTTKTVVLDDGVNIMEITIGKNEAKLNGNLYDLNAVPYIDNGKTIIPIREVAEIYNGSVKWIGDFKYVDVLN